ncbi:MAG: hypothetical protein ACRDWA_06375, partial [Acidimicrobiia bacterium]
MALHPGEAQRLVIRAGQVASAPLVSFAYARGAISGAQVDVLLEARGSAPAPFAAAERELVALALDTPVVRQLRRKLDYWLESVDPLELARGREMVHDLRSLTLRRDGEMVRI